MFKSIIPGLVSFDTDLSKISGAYLSSNFDFYTSTDKKHIIHYKVWHTKIDEYKKFDYRNGYFCRNLKTWQYFRKLAVLDLAFEYKEHSFCYTKDYDRIPFNIGDILSIGQIISDFIFLELFLEGYLFFKGCSVIKGNNKAIVIASPKMNGKTTFVTNMLGQGYKLISEDLIIIDPKNKRVFPYSPFFKNFGRLPNKRLEMTLRKNNVSYEPEHFSKIHLVEYRTTDKEDAFDQKLSEYIKINTLSLCKNPFVLDYLYKENLMESFILKINSISAISIPFSADVLENYNFDDILWKKKK